MLNKCFWENSHSSACLLYLLLITDAFFFQQLCVIKDSYIRYQMGWKRERPHSQIKACFRFIGNSAVLCIISAHSCHTSLSHAAASKFPTINHRDKAVFPALRPQAPSLWAHDKISCLPLFQPILNSQMLHVRAGLPVGGHVICVVYRPKQTNEVQSQVTSYCIKQLYKTWCHSYMWNDVQELLLSCLLAFFTF